MSVFYVIVKPENVAMFIEAITAIAKEDGLHTAVGQATSDSGDVMNVVEGRGQGLKLWAQNAPMSGQENPKLCGIYVEAHSDPNMFVVFTEPRFFRSRTAATELGERVLSQLLKAGFDVRRSPPLCGAAAIHERS